MKLSAMELFLIIDTLNGSLCIANGTGRLFIFSDEQRKEVKNKLEIYLNNMVINVDDKNIGE